MYDKLCVGAQNIEDDDLRECIIDAIEARKSLDEIYDVMDMRESQLKRIGYAITVITGTKDGKLEALSDWIDMLGPLVPTYEDWTPTPNSPADVKQKRYDTNYGEMYGQSYNLQRSALEQLRSRIQRGLEHDNELETAIKGMRLKITSWDTLYSEGHYAMTVSLVQMKEHITEEKRVELLHGIRERRS